MGVLERGATFNISEGGKVEKKWRTRIKKSHLICIVAVILLVAIAIVGYITGTFESIFKHVETKQTVPSHPSNPTKPLPASESYLRTFTTAAVCADGPPCAQIGKNILERNGSAVDATIAAMFCNGLVNMHSMGIGGGFLMTIYSREEGKAYTLNAREVAPLASTTDMFGSSQNSSRTGPLSIGVPGELRGYQAAHNRFGRLPWKDLVEPSIKLCEKGYNMTNSQMAALYENKNRVHKNWFMKDNSEWKRAGDTIVPHQLCKTLRVIAEKGADEFYTGALADTLLAELKEAGSIITKEDFEKYEVVWADPIDITFNNGSHLYSVPPPGSGALLGFIMKILDGYKFNRSSIDGTDNTVLTYHRMAEAFKYAYARRTELADPNFVNLDEILKNLTSPEYAELVRLKIKDNMTYSTPEHYGAVYFDNLSDNGTAHISVLDAHGDAVSVTSTINLYFGSGVVSEATGVTFNSVMDDFSNMKYENYFKLPGSPNNVIKPGKRPLSSMSPTIITNSDGDVVMVVGASGGTQITTAVTQVISRVLWFGQNVKEAVDAPRIHHQVYPMELVYAFGVLQQEVDGLAKIGHNTSLLTFGGSIVCALHNKPTAIFANADYRKGGDVYGLN